MQLYRYEILGLPVALKHLVKKKMIEKIKNKTVFYMLCNQWPCFVCFLGVICAIIDHYVSFLPIIKNSGLNSTLIYNTGSVFWFISIFSLLLTQKWFSWQITEMTQDRLGEIEKARYFLNITWETAITGARSNLLLILWNLFYQANWQANDNDRRIHWNFCFSKLSFVSFT